MIIYENVGFILGDEGRYLVLETLLYGDELYKFNEVKNADDNFFIVILSEFYCGNEKYLNQLKINIADEGINKESILILFSKKLRYAFILFVQNNNDFTIIKSLLEVNIICKIFIIETFPYGKQESINLVKDIKNELAYTEIKIIFITNYRKYGYTDMSSEEKAIEEAQKEYKRFINTPVIKLDKKNTIIPIDDGSDSILEQCFEKVDKKINDLKTEIDKHIKLYYENDTLEIRNTLTSLENMDLICRYSNIKKYNFIVKGYIENFIIMIFDGENSLFSKISNIYIDLIKPLVIWDLNNDIIHLKEQIRNKFSEDIEALLNSYIKMPNDELEYRKTMEKKNYDVIFKKYIKEKFLEQILPSLLNGYILEKYNKYNKLSKVGNK
jgi:hypothetical protein